MFKKFNELTKFLPSSEIYIKRKNKINCIFYTKFLKIYFKYEYYLYFKINQDI